MNDINLSIPSPEGDTICRDLWEKWLQAFAQLYQKSPRARRQLDVIYDTYLLDLPDEEIAAKVAVSRQQVQVLRTRGMAQLREDQALLAWTQELILNCM